MSKTPNIIGKEEKVKRLLRDLEINSFFRTQLVMLEYWHEVGVMMAEIRRRNEKRGFFQRIYHKLFPDA